jgi:coenzyme F420-0:L-glutamate ligase/coenzyme F420-1:gamma-L-glutamate ligase
LVTDAARREGLDICTGDVVVLAQKIVSKAEGRVIRLRSVKPSEAARRWAKTLAEDPRFLEVVLQESRRVVRMTERVLLVETHHGFTCANAGVDRSNVPGKDCVTCLPRDPDGSARRFVAGVRKLRGVQVAAIISDTFGRPWRRDLRFCATCAAHAIQPGAGYTLLCSLVPTIWRLLRASSWRSASARPWSWFGVILTSVPRTPRGA